MSDSTAGVRMTAAERLLTYAAELWHVKTNVLAIRCIVEQFSERDPQSIREREFYDWLTDLCNNPPPPSPELVNLLRDYGDHPALNRAPAVTPDNNTGQTVADES